MAFDLAESPSFIPKCSFSQYAECAGSCCLAPHISMPRIQHRLFGTSSPSSHPDQPFKLRKSPDLIMVDWTHQVRRMIVVYEIIRLTVPVVHVTTTDDARGGPRDARISSS